MRRVLLVMAIVGLGFGTQMTPVSADVNDLSQGVMIAHAPPGFTYSPGLDYCGEYPLSFAISSCGEQNNRVDLPLSAADPALWYVVSAFEEDKQWAGIQFGLGDYSANGFYFVEYGPCLVDNQTIPTDGWPGPNQGVAVVATTTNWTGNYVAIYYFIGYSYAAGTVVPLDVHPAYLTAFHGTTVPPYPSTNYDVVCLGSMGVDTDGSPCCPDGGGETAACCTGGVCTVVSEDDCLAGGGTWYSAQTTCEGFECPITGACCWNQQSCTVRTFEDCDAISGVWHEGWSCPGIGEHAYDCPNEGIIQPCCDPSQACTMNYEQECLYGGGDFFESWHSCDVDDPLNPAEGSPCDNVPTSRDTWGSIKTIYR